MGMQSMQHPCRSANAIASRRRRRRPGHDRVAVGVCGDLDNHSATDGCYHPLLCLRVHRRASPERPAGRLRSDPLTLLLNCDDIDTDDTIGEFDLLGSLAVVFELITYMYVT